MPRRRIHPQLPLQTMPIPGSSSPPRRYRKQHIPKALREALWLQHNGEAYRAKCGTPWCPNTITTHDFQAGHRIPESRGGPLTLENLIPLCARCNLSMGSSYTFEAWCALQGRRTWWQWFKDVLCCWRLPRQPPQDPPSEKTTPFLPPAVVVSNPARPSARGRGSSPTARAAP